MNHLSFLSAAALLCTLPVANAKNLKVPDEFDTIQQAVDAAVAGDVIDIVGGTFFENVFISTSAITLRGDDAAIDAEYKGSCIEIDADDVRIEKLRLINGVSALLGTGFGLAVVDNEFQSASNVAISITGDNALIRQNVITASEASIEFVANQDTSSTRIEKNVITNSDSTAISASVGQLILRKNEITNNAGGIRITTTHPLLRSEVTRNRVSRSDGTAISVVSQGAGITINKNEIDQILRNGISIFGDLSEVNDNKIATCDGDAIQVVGREAAILRNKIERVTQEGIEYVGDGPTLISGNEISKTGEEGILLGGSDIVVADNRVTRCHGDGIDLFFGTNCRIENNVTNKNGHEGIDNSGFNTVIDGNTAKKNGDNLGPDIAGAGDFGSGTVASFVGNSFNIGGATTPQRLDDRDLDLD